MLATVEEQAVGEVHRQTAPPKKGKEMKTSLEHIVRNFNDEQGSTTAEFAMVTLAAVAFAGLLISILSSGDIRGMLMSLISRALSI